MTELPTLPFEKSGALSLAPKLLELQAEAPITRVRTAMGDEAWLVTRYDDVKALFGDPRLGRSHPKPEEAARTSESVLLGSASDGFETEDVDHAKMRARLVPRFSARRMRLLKPRVEEMVDDLLAKLVAGDKPADLHESLAFPLPVLVICELLGVPFEDRTYFRGLSSGMADMRDHEKSAGAMREMHDYVKNLVRRRRSEPENDVLTELTEIEDGGLSDDEVAGLGAIILFAGHETTVTRIDVGTLLFLASPEQIDLLRGDPALVPSAVEEVLRLSVGGGGGGGMPRYARADIEFGGVTIERGEAVLLSIGAANGDRAAFPEPERFDIHRDTPNPHVSFGHGARYCIGAALARIELTAVFERLFQRIPTLRLAVPMSELKWRSHLLTGGFTEIPVTW
jgi:pentalenolactone synthase